MNKPAAIMGSLVDARNVATHKCLRLVIDVPAEQAEHIISVLGWPTQVNPIPVAVGRVPRRRRAREWPFPQWTCCSSA